MSCSGDPSNRRRRPRRHGRRDRAAGDRGRLRDRRPRGDGRARREGARADRALPPAQGRQGADDGGGARSPLSRCSRRRPTSPTSPSCDLVIEAIVEDLGAKLELFGELEGIVRPDAILATNTSALSVTEIAAARVDSPERVVGMHFFNPAPLMPLVEIVRAELSSDEAVEAAFAVGRAPRQAADPLSRHARVRRQPRSHPAAERLPTRARRGARLARGPRHGDDRRRRLADGAVHARRPRRDRRARARVGGAVREAPRAAHGAARLASSR